MRWFFLLLVVVNVAYVAWELNREQAVHADKAHLPVGVQRIVLLRELESGTSAKQDVAQLSAKAAVKQSTTTPAEEVPVTSRSPASDQDLAGATLPGNAVAVEVNVVMAEKQLAAPEEKVAVKAVAKPAGDLCYTLGPFSEMNTLRLVTREIKDYVVEASFRSKEEQEQTMFRVYVRPVGNKQEAKALIKELVSKNIRDYFIITDGPNKNGISLGFFSNKGRAYRHADRVRKLGFDATAEPVFRSYTIYWLDYRIKAGHEIPQQIVDDHLENSAQRLSRDCA